MQWWIGLSLSQSSRIDDISTKTGTSQWVDSVDHEAIVFEGSTGLQGWPNLVTDANGELTCSWVEGSSHHA